jgi:DNA-binding response OmpR family regulator
MHNKTAVICDDHATLVMLIKHLLTKQGFKVLTAGDGGEGLELVRSNGPELLLLDLNMPSTDGLEVLKGLKTVAKKPYTIVVSGHEGQEKRDEASSLGAHEVWRKPFNAAELMARIDALVQQGLI